MRPFERFAARGRFTVDGVGLERLLEACGTPCYVYSAGTIRERYRALAGALPDTEVLFSLKANPNPAIGRVLARAGAGAEVSSRHELAQALAAGVAPERIVFVAPAKRPGEIDAAVEAGIFALVVDAASELDAIADAARRAGRTAGVLLRVNTREDPRAVEKMVGGPSKFGFDEETVVGDLPGHGAGPVVVRGIQVYAASGVLDARFLVDHVTYTIALAERLSRDAGFVLSAIDFGGGFGVPYRDDDPELDLGALTRGVRPALAGVHARHAGCRLLFESGRFLVAEAGLFLTRVVRVKESRGRVFAITDGGFNNFTRPVLLGQPHAARILNRLGEARSVEVDVAGPICTPLDVIGPGVGLPMPRPGDVIGFHGAGAYGHSMSLQRFMSRGAAGEFLVDEGKVTDIADRGPCRSEEEI